MMNADIKIFSITALLLVILFLFLSRKVILLRRKNKMAIGQNNIPEFQNAIRAHANFSEYTPLALLEIFILTQMQANVVFMSILCAMILCGRVSHAAALNYFELKNPPSYTARIIGMMLTFGCLFLSAICIVGYAFIAIPS